MHKEYLMVLVNLEDLYQTHLLHVGNTFHSLEKDHILVHLFQQIQEKWQDH